MPSDSTLFEAFTTYGGLDSAVMTDASSNKGQPLDQHIVRSISAGANRLYTMERQLINLISPVDKTDFSAENLPYGMALQSAAPTVVVHQMPIIKPPHFNKAEVVVVANIESGASVKMGFTTRRNHAIGSRSFPNVLDMTGDGTMKAYPTDYSSNGGLDLDLQPGVQDVLSIGSWVDSNNTIETDHATYGNGPFDASDECPPGSGGDPVQADLYFLNGYNPYSGAGSFAFNQIRYTSGAGGDYKEALSDGSHGIQFTDSSGVPLGRPKLIVGSGTKLNAVGDAIHFAPACAGAEAIAAEEAGFYYLVVKLPRVYIGSITVVGKYEAP